MELRENAWIQVDGDVNSVDHGGVCAQPDGEDLELFSIENVEENVGNNDARDVGYPFWKSTGTYSPDDLEWSDAAKGALGAAGQEDLDWMSLPAIERACRLSQYGFNKAAGAGGGFAFDILPQEPVYGFGDDDIHLEALATDDEFNLDVLHKVEVFLCTRVNRRDWGDSVHLVVQGRHAAAEWTREAVLDAHGDYDGFEEDYLDQWRQSPFKVTLPGGDKLTAEPFHTFHSYDHSTSDLYEAAEVLCSEHNTECRQNDLDHEVISLLKDAPRE